MIFEPEMQVVEKIMRWASEGMGVAAMQTRLHAEGIPSPKGKKVWDRLVIKRVVAGDIYQPHTYSEITELVAQESAARLDPAVLYGIQWFNRDKVTVRTVSEPDGNGGRRYRKKRTSQRRPKEEWVAIPAPTSPLLTRDLVDLARATLDANTGSERKHLAREWELRGLIRCSCGYTMRTKTTNPQKRKIYRYYYCERRNKLRNMCECRQSALRVEDVEPAIWEFVSRLLTEPRRIRAGMDRLIDQERSTRRADFEGEARAWSEKLEECARLRAAYQDQQAAGLMTIDELRSKLAGLEETRRHAEAELVAISDTRDRADQLERDRDALLESMAESVPEALDGLTGEERNKVYRMLRLQVTPTAEGYEVTGALRGFLQNETSALEEVPGIGPATLEKIKPFATI